MDAIILIASVVLPLLPVVMFPTRFFGRGLGSTVVGAVLLVGLIMLLYWSLQGALNSSSGDNGDAAAAAALSDADLSALKKLF
jgi:prepilin signal peptidase PulO-like enzyme (type II secretory pathway)